VTRGLISPAAVLTVLIFTAPHAWADAQEDLAAGLKAQAAGDLDEALRLLSSAGQNLPNSVEANLAWADCLLELGRSEEALVRYQAVVKISPEHVRARRIVEALSGRRTDLNSQLAAARALLNEGAFQQAEAILVPWLTRGISASDRAVVKVLLSEVRLWNGDPVAPLADCVQVIEENSHPAAVQQAHVIAALALALQRETPESAPAHLTAAGALEGLWKTRADFARLLVSLPTADLAAVSSSLTTVMDGLPKGGYRTKAQDRVAQAVLAEAHRQLGRKNYERAVALLWPMISADPIPGEQAVAKPLKTSGGWLEYRPGPQGWDGVIDLFIAIGQAEFEAEKDRSSHLGFWLAAEVSRGIPTPEVSQDQRLRVSAILASASLPAPNRKSGEALSSADSLQLAILLDLVPTISDVNRQGAHADQLLAQVQRYAAVNDAEAVLSKLTSQGPAAAPAVPATRLADGLSGLVRGPGHLKILNGLATNFSLLGARDFSAAQATQASSANRELNAFDHSALDLYGLAAATYPDSAPSAEANGLISRYVGAEQWDAAFTATQTYYRNLPPPQESWQRLRLRMAHAAMVESRILAANLRLGAELPEEVRQALTEAVAILADHPGLATRAAVAGEASNLINRYVSLDRIDLAEAVIAGTADVPNGKNLSDWALWSRVILGDYRAQREMAVFAARPGTQTMPLVPSHKAQLELLNRLIADHPKSEFRGPAISKVLTLSQLYESARSFEVARTIVRDFAQAHADLAPAESFRYRFAAITVAEARSAFAQRPDASKPPAELLSADKAAIDTLAAFITANPTGTMAPQAETDLFSFVTQYGQSGAWPLARQVLERFKQSVPDYRSPARLRYFEAVTFLGELDSARAITLLQPPPPPAATSPVDEKTLIAAWRERGGASDEAMSERLRDLFAIANSPDSSGDSAPSVGTPLGSLPGGGGPQPGMPGPGGSAGSFGGGFAYGEARPAAEPSQNDLAMANIQEQLRRRMSDIAMMQGQMPQLEMQAAPQGVVLASGLVLSEAEMQRQDAAADQAYAILIELVKESGSREPDVTAQAREEINWLFGFFEGQTRADHAIVLIERFLKDVPEDAARADLTFRAITDQLAFAGQRQQSERIDQTFLDSRHERFEAARQRLSDFVTGFADKKPMVQRAQMLLVDSFALEAQLASAVSVVRSGGLHAQTAKALLDLLERAPDHPDVAGFPARLWAIAESLSGPGQQELAVHVLSQIPIHFPTDPHATAAVQRIAQRYATNLANPLKAVEAYQEYLSLAGDNESIRAEIFSIGQQLAAQQRYLEALHVFGVFVDSFPTDPRAAEALRSIGQTHQFNEAWKEAIAAYDRVLDEYKGSPIEPQVKLAMADCQIHLSQWRAARRLYDEFLAQFGGDGSAALAQSRLDVLKALDRFDTLISDADVQRNKDDAQFQIARIVLEQLQNPLKAVVEFRKVTAGFPKSDLADDAQLEIGRALLTLGRLDEARLELLEVPKRYPNSPVADDALYLVAHSYEQQAEQLAAVTLEGAKKMAFERGQRGAYLTFNNQAMVQQEQAAGRRAQLKKEGKELELGLEEASTAWRMNGGNLDYLSNTIRAAEIQSETDSALELANRQDRINEAYRQAVAAYSLAANDYPLGDMTDDSLLQMAQIFEVHLKDRPAAMTTYQSIVKFFPGTPVAEDAAWKVATFYEEEGKYDEAGAAYRDFIRNYPASGRVADAQFALAESLEQRGKWVEAMDAYETFRQKFTSHPKAALALDQINWIKTYRK
jgi:TolA-binding protein